MTETKALRRPVTHIEVGNWDDYLRVTRYWALKVCRNPAAGWDWEDLWGYLYESLLKWPPTTPQEVIMRCRSSTYDWHRERLGRNENMKHDSLVVASIDVPVSPQPAWAISPITWKDMIPDGHANTSREALEAITFDWLPLMFKGRDKTIAEMAIRGYNLREIGEFLGVTESRVSQIMTTRIKPPLRKLFDLPGAKNRAEAAYQ